MADDKNKQIDLEKATKIVEETCDPEILEDDDSLTEDEKYIRESAWLLLQELEGEDEDEEEDDDEDEEEEEEDSEESSEDSSDTSSTTTETGVETSTISDIVAEQGISTVGTVLAQVQSLGLWRIIAMSSALYFQGTAVVDNVPLYDDINFQIDNIMEQEAMNMAINMAVEQSIQQMSEQPVVVTEDEESEEENEEESEEKKDDKKEEKKNLKSLM